MPVSAVLAALLLQSVGPGWGFRPDVDFVGEYLPLYAIAGVLGSAVVAFSFDSRAGFVWGLLVGCALALLIPLQRVAGSEPAPDQRIGLFFGPPALVVVGAATALVGSRLGGMARSRSKEGVR